MKYLFERDGIGSETGTSSEIIPQMEELKCDSCVTWGLEAKASANSRQGVA